MKKESSAGNVETVLYRAYRPQSFAEVFGQEPVVATLEASIKNGRVSHAYLFSGSRGTGKTSDRPHPGKERSRSRPNDIYEIDAASNRGIDDVRELRDGVAVHAVRVPLQGLYSRRGPYAFKGRLERPS